MEKYATWHFVNDLCNHETYDNKRIVAEFSQSTSCNPQIQKEQQLHILALEPAAA